jgi:hypothetical protein
MGAQAHGGSILAAQTIPRGGYRLTAISGIASGIVSGVGLILLVLFYAIEVPNPKGGYSLGNANDVSGVLWMLLMIPLAVGLWQTLPSRRGRDKAILCGAVVMMAASAIAGFGLVTHVLSDAVSLVVTGPGSILVVIWIGLISRRAGRARAMASGVSRLGQVIAVSLLVDALVVGGAFLVGTVLALPETARLLATFVVAIPGILAYAAVPVWCTWVGLAYLERR